MSSHAFLVCFISMACLFLLSSSTNPPLGCGYEDLSCLNGGTFDAENCTQWATPCGTAFPDPTNFRERYVCDCTDEFTGTNCQLLKPPTDPVFNGTARHPCPATFDGGFYNTALNQTEKHIECFLTYTYLQDGAYDLRQHRINATIMINADLTYNIIFDLMSRHRNLSMGPSGNQPCGPVEHDAICTMRECAASVSGSSVTYTCPVVSCTSCGSDPSLGCSAYLAGVVVGAKPPFTLEFDSFSGVGGYSSGTFVMNWLNINLQCYTGQCAFEPVPFVFVPKDSFVPYYVTLGCLVFTLILVYIAQRATRRPKGLTVVTGLQSTEPMDPYRVLAVNNEENLPSFGLVFEGITYTVQMTRCCSKTPPKRILTNINGVVHPGQMVAILGSSGAGKSSLMDILADREKSGEVGGFVGVFGDRARCHRIKKIASYVLQEDHLMTTQTVSEALTFSARIRLPLSFTEMMIENKVTKMLEMLKIDQIANSKIGDTDHGGGISGGERKRLAIGMELIINPRLLFLDEPTSGLDSYSTQVVVEVLRQSADNGTTIIMTIHQPPSDVFNSFHQIVLLNKNGEMAYMGPPQEALEYMREVGHLPSNQWVNPSEFLVNVASREVDMYSKLPELFWSSPQGFRVMKQAISCKQMALACMSVAAEEDELNSDEEPDEKKPMLANGLPNNDKPPSVRDLAEPVTPPSDVSPRYPRIYLRDPDGKYGDDFGGQMSPGTFYRRKWENLPLFKRSHPNSVQRFFLLSGRSFRNILRDPSLLLLQGGVTIIVAILVGLIFYQLDMYIGGIQNRVGVLFFIILYFSLVSLSSLGSLSTERRLFNRERAARFYTTLPYYLSKLGTDLLPLRIFPPVVFACISYWLMGLKADYDAFLFFVYCLVLTNLVATAACFAISAAFNSPSQANLWASLLFIFSALFGGLFLNNQSSGTGLTRLNWLSFFHYGYEALMTNEFSGLPLVFNPAGGGYGEYPINGVVVLDNYGLDPTMMYQDVYILLGIFIGLVVIGYLLLRCKRVKK